MLLKFLWYCDAHYCFCCSSKEIFLLTAPQTAVTWYSTDRCFFSRCCSFDKHIIEKYAHQMSMDIKQPNNSEIFTTNKHAQQQTNNSETFLWRSTSRELIKPWQLDLNYGLGISWVAWHLPYGSIQQTVPEAKRIQCPELLSMPGRRIFLNENVEFMCRLMFLRLTGSWGRISVFIVSPDVSLDFACLPSFCLVFWSQFLLSLTFVSLLDSVVYEC